MSSMPQTALRHWEQQQQQHDVLRLKVGAVVAYECLLDEAAGTTSWRIGTVRALTTSTGRGSTSADFNTPYTAVKDGLYLAEEEIVMMTSAQPTPQQQQHESSPHSPAPSPAISKTKCQTVLIQPWISLAATPAGTSNNSNMNDYSSGDADNKGGKVIKANVGAMKGGKPTSSSTSCGASPRLLPAANLAVRSADIVVLQRELEEIQRFARGDGGAEDAEEKRLAKTLWQACMRIMLTSTAADLEGSGVQHLNSSGSGGDADGNHRDATAELTRKIDAKRKEFRQRVEQLLAEMKETRKQQRDLLETQAKAEQILQDARRQLREAQEKVQRIDTRALREIQGYRFPPAVVKLVMSAVLCVLGEKAATWQEVVSVMRTPAFIARVATFDATQLTHARVYELKRNYLSDPHFSHEDAMKGSQSLEQLHEWVMRQVQLADADADLARFLAQKESSTAALAATRQKMVTDAAELQHLEEELDVLLHERMRQNKELTKNGRSSAAEGENQRQQPPPSQDFRPSTTSPPATPRSHSRQLSAGASATDNASADSPEPISTHLRTNAAASQVSGKELSTDGAATAATDDTPMSGPSSSLNTATSARTSSTAVQLQQQAFALFPPGPQWVCVPEGIIHSIYVLRSSILCVLDCQASDDAAKDNESDDDATALSDTSVFELTKAQQQFICDAMQQPLNERPPVPLTEEEAAAAAAEAAARQSSVTTHHTKSFDGEEWDMVVEDSPDELRRAIVDDVAALCEVPNRAVTSVTWVLGSLYVECDVCHPASMTSAAVQAAMEDGAYPAVMALYEGRQRLRDSLEEDATRQLQQASRLAMMEEEIQAAQQAEASAKRDLQKVRENFERQQHELAEQIAVAQTSSQVDCLDEAREYIALREAMQDVQAAVKERDGQIARLQARLRTLQEAQQDAEAKQAAARALEAKHSKALAEAGQKLDAAQKELADAEQRANAAQEQAIRTQKQAAAEKSEHEQALKDVQANAEKAKKEAAAAAAAEAAARQSSVTTHHTKSFDGEEWDMVVEDSPDELRRAIVDDVAALCEVPNRAVTSVTWVLGSLYVECDVCHPASVTSAAVQAEMEDGAYPTVMALYEGRQHRRAQNEAEAEATARQHDHLAELEQKLREATAAQMSLRHTLQALELTRTATLERVEQEHQQALTKAKDDAKQAVSDLTQQLHALQAAREEEAKRHESELADAEKKLADAEQRANATQEQAMKAQQQALTKAKDDAKQAVSDLTQQLHALQAAREEEAKRHESELAAAQAEREAAAATSHSTSQKLGAAQKELADTEKKLKVTNNALKKLESQSRREAKEAEKKAQQQRSVVAKEAEKTTAEAERKLRAAQAALQEQGKVHQKELERLLSRLAESEATRQQLQSALASARTEEQQAAARQRQLKAVEEDVQDKRRQLVAALQAHIRAAETARSACAEAQQRQSKDAGTAATRRVERRRALESICDKVKELAMRSPPPVAASPFFTESAVVQRKQKQQLSESKAALSRELAAQLHAMKKDKDDAAAAVAQSRRATAVLQRSVDGAGNNVQRCHEAKVAVQSRLRALREGAEGGNDSGAAAAVAVAAVATTTADSEAEKGDELAALETDVATAVQGFATAKRDLALQEELRLQACAEEEEATAKLLRSVDAEHHNEASQLMREVQDLATRSFLERHQTVCMNTCLCTLLFTAVATLQYKKYAV
ncbi:kinetoplast-associated protein-like protein [Lotmaria passim]